MDKLMIAIPMLAFPKSGGMRVLVELANGLTMRGHEVCLVIASSFSGSAFPIDPRVNVIYAEQDANIIRKMLWIYSNIPRNVDIVVANYYLTSYITGVFCGKERKRGIYLIQGYEPDFFLSDSNRKFKWIQRNLAKLSYRLPLLKVTISCWLQSMLHKEIGHTVPVIHDGVNTEIFTPETEETNITDQKIIMILGRTEPGKGMQDFLDALSILNKHNHNYRLLVVTQDRKLRISSPIPVEIVFPLNDEHLANCYKRADLFVFSSKREGFGLPPLESMACGVPVITTDCGGISDYAVDGVNCLIVPVGDPIAMSQAISHLADDDQLMKKLAAAGRRTSLEFTWSAMVDKFEKIATQT